MFFLLKMNALIRPQFCTCPNSIAVGTCAKLWPDCYIKIRIIIKHFAHEIWVTSSWAICDMNPRLQAACHTIKTVTSNFIAPSIFWCGKMVTPTDRSALELLNCLGYLHWWLGTQHDDHWISESSNCLVNCHQRWCRLPVYLQWWSRESLWQHFCLKLKVSGLTTFWVSFEHCKVTAYGATYLLHLLS